MLRRAISIQSQSCELPEATEGSSDRITIEDGSGLEVTGTSGTSAVVQPPLFVGRAGLSRSKIVYVFKEVQLPVLCNSEEQRLLIRYSEITNNAYLSSGHF